MQNIRIKNAKNGGFLITEDHELYGTPIAALSNSGDLLRWMTEQFIKPQTFKEFSGTDLIEPVSEPAGDEWIFNTSGKPPGYYPYKLYEYQLRNGVIGRTSNDLDLNWTIYGDSPHAVIKHRVIPGTERVSEPEQDGFITLETLNEQRTGEGDDAIAWKKWDGTECPLRNNKLVEYLTSVLSPPKRTVQYQNLNWSGKGEDAIKYYRVLPWG